MRNRSYTTTKASSSSSASGGRWQTLAVASSSVALASVAVWRVLLWRARTRLRLTVERVQGLLPPDGPLVSVISGLLIWGGRRRAAFEMFVLPS